MEEPARKRRKTTSPEVELGDGMVSPLKKPPRRPSFSSRSFITASERQSSPLKEPPRRFPMSPTKGASDRPSSPLKGPPRRPSRRPSFASPTKASLSRGYPELLQRPSSSGEANGRANMLARGKEARAFILGDKDAVSQAAPPVIVEEAEQTSAGARSPHPSKAPQNNTTPRAHRTQPGRKETLAAHELENEADLPTTPSQGALSEQYSPRPGLFSSPSKRPPRLKNSIKQSSLHKKMLDVEQNGADIPSDESVQDTRPEAQDAPQEKNQPPDPEIEGKKREKDRLKRELETLRNQVSRCTEEISKIQAQSTTHVESPEETAGLITFINTLCSAGEESAVEKFQPISSLLCSFLPFSTRQIAPPKPGPESPIASHRPLELDDPLPYLEMFTSFRFSTKLSLPRGQNPSSASRVHQKHTIDITGPQNLLSATVSITIDTLTNTIIDLKLLQLPHWADRELGSFIRAKAKKQDLGNACWAIGSYWDIAKKRAEYWHRCEVAFAHLIPGRTSEDSENIDVRSRGKSEQSLSRKDINRHLGRDTLVLEDRHVLLKINWKIGFDWTGEAESEVDVVPAVPQVWSEADEMGSFKKIPETFTSLLQSKGVFAATKTMVALLFSE